MRIPQPYSAKCHGFLWAYFRAKVVQLFDYNRVSRQAPQSVCPAARRSTRRKESRGTPVPRHQRLPAKLGIFRAKLRGRRVEAAACRDKVPDRRQVSAPNDGYLETEIAQRLKPHAKLAETAHLYDRPMAFEDNFPQKFRLIRCCDRSGIGGSKISFPAAPSLYGLGGSTGYSYNGGGIGRNRRQPQTAWNIPHKAEQQPAFSDCCSAFFRFSIFPDKLDPGTRSFPERKRRCAGRARRYGKKSAGSPPPARLS